jgi:hypothetical protein
MFVEDEDLKIYHNTLTKVKLITYADSSSQGCRNAESGFTLGMLNIQKVFIVNRSYQGI